MALVPIVYRDWWGDYLNGQLRPFELLDKYTDLFPEDILPIIDNGSMQGNNRKRPRNFSHSSDENTEPTISKQSNDGFQIFVEVKQFKPEEISVKITDDKYIIVEGKHEEGEEDDERGCIFRRLVRHYQLPEGIDERKIQTSFSSDGILTISATNLPLPATKDRSIKITRAMESAKDESKKASDCMA